MKNKKTKINFYDNYNKSPSTFCSNLKPISKQYLSIITITNYLSKGAQPIIKRQLNQDK